MELYQSHIPREAQSGLRFPWLAMETGVIEILPEQMLAIYGVYSFWRIQSRSIS